MKKLSPIVSEFDTVEAAQAYDLWLRQKVEESLADDSPSVPHDEAMARVRGIIEARRGARTRLAG